MSSRSPERAAMLRHQLVRAQQLRERSRELLRRSTSICASARVVLAVRRSAVGGSAVSGPGAPPAGGAACRGAYLPTARTVSMSRPISPTVSHQAKPPGWRTRHGVLRSDVSKTI